MRRVLIVTATLVLMLCSVVVTSAQQAATATLSGRVTDPALNVLRTLDLLEPWGHASLGQLASDAHEVRPAEAK